MVTREELQKRYGGFIAEISNDLQGKKQGYVKSIPVGSRIFPGAIPPQLQIMLLDPEQQIIRFRRICDPDSRQDKWGEWQVGQPIDAVACVIDWASDMKEAAGSSGGWLEEEPPDKQQ